MGIETINLKKKFHTYGYKYTEQRQIIYDIMVENKNLHLSIEDISLILKEKGFFLGQSTIYRTLIMLEKMKIARKTEFDDKFTRYELRNHEKHAHHHLICSSCGSIIDIEDDLLFELERQINEKYGFKIHDHCLTFFGECRNCGKV